MITIEEAISAREFHDNTPRPNGTCRVWRRNGQTQTWKTRPGHFKVPVKYGLYDYGYITHDNAQWVHLPSETCNRKGVQTT